MVMPSRVGLGLVWPNPKFGLGFMTPIWVEKGPEGLHPESVTTRGRASIHWSMWTSKLNKGWGI